VIDSGFVSGSEKPIINTRPVEGGRGRPSDTSSGFRVNSVTGVPSENFISFGVTETLMELGGAVDLVLRLRTSI